MTDHDAGRGTEDKRAKRLSILIDARYPPHGASFHPFFFQLIIDRRGNHLIGPRVFLRQRRNAIGINLHRVVADDIACGKRFGKLRNASGRDDFSARDDIFPQTTFSRALMEQDVPSFRRRCSLERFDTREVLRLRWRKQFNRVQRGKCLGCKAARDDPEKTESEEQRLQWTEIKGGRRTDRYASTPLRASFVPDRRGLTR